MRRPAAALLALAACAAPAAHPAPEQAPLVFTRPRGAWAPEQLNQDVVACVDAADAALRSEPGLPERPPGTASARLRERTVACMQERGWRLGVGPAGEGEWSE